MLALGLRRFRNFHLINQSRFWVVSMERKTCHSLLIALKREKKGLFDIFLGGEIQGVITTA